MNNEEKKKESFDSFDQKLAAFEKRVNASKNKAHTEMADNTSELWRIVVRAGVELFSGFAVGVAIGFGLDYWLSTKPWCMIVFSILGMAAGVLNVWRIVKPSDISTK